MSIKNIHIPYYESEFVANDNKPPLITTIIPTYRRPQLLYRSIKSVLNQTYPNIIVKVFDNASGDETRKIVREISKTDNRVSYWCHDKNIGAANNFQFGLDHIETSYFSLLSDDDMLYPRFYEVALKGFDDCRDAIFSACGMVNVDKDSKIKGIRTSTWKSGIYQPPQGLLSLLNNRGPAWTSILFRREILKKIGRLDCTVGAPADIDFVLRAAARFPIVFNETTGAAITLHDGSFSSNLELSDIWPGFKTIIDRLCNEQKLSEDTANQVNILMKRWLADKLYSLAKRYIICNKHEKLNDIFDILDNYCERSDISHKILAISTVIKLLPVIKKPTLYINRLKNSFKWHLSSRINKPEDLDICLNYMSDLNKKTNSRT